MKLKALLGAAVLAAAALAGGSASAQDMDLTKPETYATIMEWAAQPLDTAKLKKEPPFTIGLSAGYLSNAWINFTAQSVRYEASLHPEIGELKVTDAAWNP